MTRGIEEREEDEEGGRREGNIAVSAAALRLRDSGLLLRSGSQKELHAGAWHRFSSDGRELVFNQDVFEHHD